MTPLIASFGERDLEEAKAIACSAGLEASTELTSAGAVLVTGDGTQALLSTVPQGGARSVWHGSAPIGRFDAPSPAELAIGDILEATDGFAASATILTAARDGRQGSGPIDALRLEPGRDVKIGCRWICGVDTVSTQQTRCSLVSLTFTSRLSSRDVDRRLREAPRLRHLPDWAKVFDTAALAEVMGDPLWPDDLSKAATVLALRMIDQLSTNSRSWKIWVACPPGATVLGLADMIGRVAGPELSSVEVRRRVNAASGLRRNTRAAA